MAGFLSSINAFLPQRHIYTAPDQLTKSNRHNISLHNTHPLQHPTMTSNTRQVALVIGASRGIGRQVAIDLAKEGYAGKLFHPPHNI